MVSPARARHLAALAAKGDEQAAPTRWFKQRLDHFNEMDTRTWSQRSWINDASYQSGGPIYVQIGGEGAASAGYVQDFAMNLYAQQTNAVQVALEHRFYGRSHPLPSLASANLQYLTSQQALGDLANFVDSVRKMYPDAGKVVVFGGSYPGALASFFRTKFPTVVDFAVSTSSPVHAVLDMVSYLDVVDQSLAKIGGASCDAAMRAAFQQVDSMLTSAAGCAKLSGVFNTCHRLDPSQPNDVATFLSNIIGNVMGTVQYDNEIPGAPNIKQVCAAIESTQDPLSGLLAVTQLYDSDGACVGISYDDQVTQLRNTTVFGSTGVGMRQWTWQTCNEFGFFQSTDAPPSAQPFGVGIPVAYYTQLCTDVFGVAGPHIEFTNNYYGSTKAAATVGSVLYVNSGLDPWKSLSVLHNDTAHGVQAYIVADAGHCSQMSPYRPGMNPAIGDAQRFIGDVLRSIA